MMIQQIQSILESIGKFDSKYEIEEVKESNNNQVFFHNDIVCKVSKKSDNLELEYDVLKRINDHGKFPKVIHYCEVAGNYFLFMERLAGRGIEYEWKILSVEQKKEIISQIIKNMKIIHSYSSTSPVGYIERSKEKFKTYYEKAINNPHVSISDLEKLSKNFFHNLGNCTFGKDILVHHDLWYKNILVDQGNLTGIIDFETALYAPKEVELFRLFHHKDCAQSYINSGSEEYTEIEYLDMLLAEIEEQYPELYLYDKIFFNCYNLESYIQKLSRYAEKWYDHGEVVSFYDSFCKE